MSSSDNGEPARDDESESFVNDEPSLDDQALSDVANIIDGIVNSIDVPPKKSKKHKQSVEFFDFNDETLNSAAICRNCIAFHPILPILVMGSCKESNAAGPETPAEYVSVWDVTKPYQKQRNLKFNTCTQVRTHFSFNSTGEYLVIASDNIHLQRFELADVLRTDGARELGTDVKPKECAIGGGCAAVPYQRNIIKEDYYNLSLSSLRCFAVNPTASEYDILTGYFSDDMKSSSLYTTGIFLNSSSKCKCKEPRVPLQIAAWAQIRANYKVKSLAFCYKPSDIPGVIFAAGYRVVENGIQSGMVHLCHYARGTDGITQNFSNDYNTRGEILSIACHPALPIIAVVSEEQTQILKYNPFDINDKDLQMVHRIYGLHANSIAFHPSLPILAVTSLNRISLWLCEPVHKYRVKELHFDMGSTIECIAFHPNPELNYMAAVSRNRTRVWNIEPIIKQLLSENPFKILITIFGNIANTLIHRFTIEQQQIVFRPRFVRWILSRVLTTVFPEGVHITDDSLYDILKLFFIINPRDHTGIPLKTLFPPTPKRGGGSKRMKRKKWTIKKLKKPISRKMKLRNKSINRRNRVNN